MSTDVIISSETELFYEPLETESKKERDCSKLSGKILILFSNISYSAFIGGSSGYLIGSASMGKDLAIYPRLPFLGIMAVCVPCVLCLPCYCSIKDDPLSINFTASHKTTSHVVTFLTEHLGKTLLLISGLTMTIGMIISFSDEKKDPMAWLYSLIPVISSLGLMGIIFCCQSKSKK
jgi:hypothetical protein